MSKYDLWYIMLLVSASLLHGMAEGAWDLPATISYVVGFMVGCVAMGILRLKEEDSR